MDKFVKAMCYGMAGFWGVIILEMIDEQWKMIRYDGGSLEGLMSAEDVIKDHMSGMFNIELVQHRRDYMKICKYENLKFKKAAEAWFKRSEGPEVGQYNGQYPYITKKARLDVALFLKSEYDRCVGRYGKTSKPGDEHFMENDEWPEVDPGFYSYKNVYRGEF